MLHYVKLRHVGPAPALDIEFAPRMNFLTGDNGLGKSFLLDIAWWALTRTWVQSPAAPHRGHGIEPSIAFKLDSKTRFVEHKSTFDRGSQSWSSKLGRPVLPGLVIYAQADGGFSAWDPARNYWRKLGSRDYEAPDRPAAYLFRPGEVWDGLPLDAPKKLCNGLIHDWAAWQRENGPAFEQLTRVLRCLSPSPDEPLVPGELQRLALDDVRDQPTLQTPYGQQVALVHASAAMRRIVALAYLLVWAWNEHLRAVEILGQAPEQNIIFLIDEIEAHLHPRWQRRIMPALLDVIETLTGTQGVSLQLIVATHSPLVLASVEPYFDQTRDALWELDLEGYQVTLTRSPWRRRGDVNSWLSSEIFDLGEPRSIEAEAAMQRALALLRHEQPQSLAEIESVDAELRKVLSDVDRFWVRWSAFVEERRAAP
jgi:hypothetical protein